MVPLVHRNAIPKGMQYKDYNCSTRVVKSYSGFYDVLMNQRHLQPTRLIFSCPGVFHIRPGASKISMYRGHGTNQL